MAAPGCELLDVIGMFVFNCPVPPVAANRRGRGALDKLTRLIKSNQCLDKSRIIVDFIKFRNVLRSQGR